MTTNELVNKIESIPGMSCDVSPFGIGCIDVLDLSQGGDGDHIIARIVMNIKNQVDTSGWLPKVVPDEVMSIIVEYVMTPVSERGWLSDED